jgi:hypothetical protein
MRRALVAGVAVALLASAYVAYRVTAQETKTSFSVGDSTPAYDVVDVTGPNKGKQLCYV